MEGGDKMGLIENAGIQCIEVLVSRKSTAGTHPDLWPLSVYSLENHPVKPRHAERGVEVFHFMLYDWERTIRHVLQENRVPYSIIQYFVSDSIFPELPAGVHASSRYESTALKTSR